MFGCLQVEEKRSEIIEELVDIDEHLAELNPDVRAFQEAHAEEFLELEQLKHRIEVA